ncbi:GNAT family protein [Sphingomonas sp. BIUV-7]|uniref:GNAT family protein n=2 Tax=Sphingomonas natans TaxID=3063330 RepID=A0ABT8Y543_9SPHN|nr:GNAT family protein [Sphingomonas sp. BIUV-7]
MTPPTASLLKSPPSRDGIRLVPLSADHREGLRAVCAEDVAIWEIYPVNFGLDGFDAAFDIMLARPDRIIFVIHDGDALVGMTGYILTMIAYQTVEIGNSYIRPAARGTGLNGRLKRLMIDHAFASGIRRVELRADSRNTRSCAAIRKVGGVLDGVLRQERATWTGHVRDTCVFSILASEWPNPSTAG